MLRNTIYAMKWMNHNMKGYRLRVFLLTILLSIVSLSNVAIAVISKKLVDVATSGNKKYVYGLILVYAVFVLSEILIASVNNYLNENIWQKLSIKIRVGLFRKLVNASWLDFNKIHSGDYVFRFNQDTAVITSGLVDDIPQIISSLIKFIAAFCVLLYYQPMIALFTFIFGPIAFVLSRFYAKRLKTIYKSIEEIDSEINGRLQEYFHNIQIVKAFGLEEMISKDMGGIYSRRKGLVLKNTMISNILSAIKSFLTWGGYIIAYSVGIFGIYQGTISFGVLVVFLQLFNQVQEPLSGIAGSIPNITACLVSAERIIEIEKLKQDEVTSILDAPSGIMIKLEDVSFAYPNREYLLRNINLIAKLGEIVLLLGKSGSGKTTLIRLILSLIEPDAGTINFIDGSDNSYTANPGNRQWISYVPQGASLFSGTIASNIRYGNSTASDEEIRSALISAEAWEFVDGLKDGIYSNIGERGIGVSEGQAQRLAIARALVHKAPAIILDEVTSGLDPETERRVMENIRRDFKMKTFIVITHRNAVKKYADRIYRLQDGALLQEEGSI